MISIFSDNNAEIASYYAISVALFKICRENIRTELLEML